MVKYEEFVDNRNPKKPVLENIAKQLEIKIAEIESVFNVKFVSACFLGEEDILQNGETDTFMCATNHDKKHKYMLFFTK